MSNTESMGNNKLRWYNRTRGDVMGLVKTRRLAAMWKQQRAKAGMKPPAPKQARKVVKSLESLKRG